MHDDCKVIFLSSAITQIVPSYYKKSDHLFRIIMSSDPFSSLFSVVTVKKPWGYSSFTSSRMIPHFNIVAVLAY